MPIRNQVMSSCVSLQVSTITTGGWQLRTWRWAQCQWKLSWPRPTWWRTCSMYALSASSLLLPRSQSILSQSTWKMVGRTTLCVTAWVVLLITESIKRKTLSQGDSVKWIAHLKTNELEILLWSYQLLFGNHLQMCLSLSETIVSLISCSITLNIKDGVIGELCAWSKDKDIVLYSGSNMLICYRTLAARAQAWTKDWAAPCVSPFSWVIVLSDVCSTPATLLN